MFAPRRPQKTYAYYRRTDPAGYDVDGGGAAAPSASTPPSAKSDRALDGNAVGGSPLRRTTSAPRPGHRRQGLLQGPGPSRRLSRPRRSLSQLSPEDTSPARGLGNCSGVGPASGWPDQALADEASFRANSASVHADAAASGSGSSQSGRGFSFNQAREASSGKANRAEGLLRLRDMDTSLVTFARGNSHLVKRFS
jgi:hypothetical protein